MKAFVFLLGVGLSLQTSQCYAASTSQTVQIKQDQLWVDQTAQPQLFGAELQYFRLRGGYGPNVPKKKVMELWNRALDRMVDAGMNTISFYIPWDFHEIAEGKFDFTGTADEDGDGKPDYPSRDLITFFRLVEEHGIHRIMVRPGPYINAEWGFLGFGAIPLWFHTKYPDSHMRNAKGERTKLYDYHNPDLLRHSQLWFEELYRQVLKDRIGTGKPILFLQLDNETNFMWQSIYNHDYGAPAQARYREFLSIQYQGDLAKLNQAQGTKWRSWSEVKPPIQPGLQLKQDQDWYSFQDETIHSYLKKIRRIWEKIGVREPEVIFTLAESYNAMAHGLLPNFGLRSDPGKTGMMTVNMYPKTDENPKHPFLNLPFKSDHDVKAMQAAQEHYFGRPEQWVMGPEIQGGWWKGIEVSSAARQQTYLSTIAHGMKALLVYYFTEGDHWQSEWARKQIQPIFDRLRKGASYAALPENQLPEGFWRELQASVDREIMVGFDARHILKATAEEEQSLFFDAPLDGNAQPRSHYDELKKVGVRYLKSYQAELGRARSIEDAVVILKDDRTHVPAESLDSVKVGADWSAGLLGWIMQTGANPKIRHWGLSSTAEISSARIIFNQDTGLRRSDVSQFFRSYLEKGGVVVNLLEDTTAKDLGLSFEKTRVVPAAGGLAVRHSETLKPVFARGSFVDHYLLPPSSAETKCLPLMTSAQGVVGYRCQVGKGVFIQIGALIYDLFNSDDYAVMENPGSYRDLMSRLLTIANVTPAISPELGLDRLVASGRKDAVSGRTFVTIKNGAELGTPVRLRLQAGVLGQAQHFKITDLLSGASSIASRASLLSHGFVGNPLRPIESTVYLFEPLP